MPQQQSPFLEGKYGWNFGESGWNTDMDENLLKFSYMFDRNVDGIVSSLPTAVNGQAYFLTTDNRLYFAVGNTWYSSPVPKWFEFKIRATGDVYQFNGTSVVQIESLADPANKVYRQGNILGTVSQSAGIPTGAVIERGSNANGEYVRFADGTQICTGEVSGTNISNATGNVFTSDDVLWSYPSSFSSAVVYVSGEVRNFGAVWVSGGSAATTASACSRKATRGASFTGNFTMRLTAIGRWY